MDLARYDEFDDAVADMRAAQEIDLGDYFSFIVKRTEDLGPEEGAAAIRFRVAADLAGRRFEQVVVDVGLSGPLPAEPERLALPNLLAFAGLPPFEAPTLPLEQHVAEKFHAYTRSYEGGQRSSRTKDLVDLVLIASTARFEYKPLRTAVEDTFRLRSTHPLPIDVPLPLDNWAVPYERLALSVSINPALATAHRDVAGFLDPVLGETLAPNAQWNSVQSRWAERDH